MLDKDSIGAIHRDIMRRCYEEKYKLYKDYGAKGRRVCDEWHDRETFRQWAETHGYEKGLRLLRHDTKGDFEPNNCYFAESPTKFYDYSKAQETRKRRQSKKEIMNKLGVTNIENHPAYQSYRGMHNRCLNPNTPQYHSYGARGIKICEEWSGKDGIYNFLLWVNSCEEYQAGLTIERIDVDGDYCPENCTWVTMYEQAQNKRRNHIFIVNGERMSAMAYCRYRNLDYNKFIHRLNKGWSMNEILDDLEK